MTPSIIQAGTQAAALVDRTFLFIFGVSAAILAGCDKVHFSYQ